MGQKRLPDASWCSLSGLFLLVWVAACCSRKPLNKSILHGLGITHGPCCHFLLNELEGLDGRRFGKEKPIVQAHGTAVTRRIPFLAGSHERLFVAGS